MNLLDCGASLRGRIYACAEVAPCPRKRPARPAHFTPTAQLGWLVCHDALGGGGVGSSQPHRAWCGWRSLLSLPPPNPSLPYHHPNVRRRHVASVSALACGRSPPSPRPWPFSPRRPRLGALASPPTPHSPSASPPSPRRPPARASPLRIRPCRWHPAHRTQHPASRRRAHTARSRAGR